jgi:enamine deaminase RidA (YjgF/YER057c/UK114 family)
MERVYLNPTGLPDWSDSFSQVVVVPSPGCRLVFISGQVGVGPDKALAGDGGFEAQVSRSFENLGAALAAAGAAWADVVKLTAYGVGYAEPRAAPLVRAIRSHFPPGRLPALSLVGVQALAERGLEFEVEAVAVTDAAPRSAGGG